MNGTVAAMDSKEFLKKSGGTVIRNFSSDDTSGVCALLESCNLLLQGFDYCRLGPEDTFIAVTDSSITGIVNLIYSYQSKLGYITLFAVSPEYRGTFLPVALYLYIEERAQNLDLTHVVGITAYDSALTTRILQQCGAVDVGTHRSFWMRIPCLLPGNLRRKYGRRRSSDTPGSWS